MTTRVRPRLTRRAARVLVTIAAPLASQRVAPPPARAAACTVPKTVTIRNVPAALDQCYDHTFSHGGQTHEVHVYYSEDTTPDNAPCTTASVPVSECEHALADTDDANGDNVQAVALAPEVEMAWRFYLDRGLDVLSGGRELDVFIGDDPRLGGIPTGNGIGVDDEGVDNADQVWKRIIAIHEIQHLVQLRYDDLSGWQGMFGEGIARASEDRVDTAVDLDTGHLFIPEINGLLGGDGTRRDTLENYSYPSAAFWTWLSDTYGAAGETQPDIGWGALRAYYEELATESNQVTALRDVVGTLGGSWTDDWIDYTLSLWAYRFAPADERLTFRDTEIRTATSGLSGHTTRSGNPAPVTDTHTMSARSSQYTQYTPNASCGFVNFNFDGNGTRHGFSVLSQDASTLRDRWTSYATEWARTVRTEDIDSTVGVVSAVDNAGTVDVSSGCVQPTLNIARPTTAAFATVGSADDPRRFIVRLEVRGPDGSGVAGLETSAFDVQLRKQGGGPLIDAEIVSSAYVQDDYWLLVQAPGAGSGAETGAFYDVSATLGTVADTEARSVLYVDQGPQDVVMVLDRSGSMGGGTGRIEAARNAANLLANELADADLGGYVRYSTTAEVREELARMDAANQRADLQADIAAETPSGNTSIGAGMLAAAAEHDARGVDDHRCSFVLLSDGDENTDPMWDDVRAQVTDNGCAIHSIALGPEANEPLMQAIGAAVPGGSYDYADVNGDVPIGTGAPGSSPGAAGAIGWQNGLARIYDYSAAQIGGRQRLLSRAGSRSVECTDDRTVLDFSDLPAGIGEFPSPPSFGVGGTVETGGVTLTGEPFALAGGGTTTSGSAHRSDAQAAGGSGAELSDNNLLVDFGFGVTGCALTLRFGDAGGSENLRVNGALAVVGDLAELDGTTLGGVAVDVTAQPGSSQGTLTLGGPIRSFAIGGQEFFVDDVVLTRSAPERQRFTVDETTDRLVLSLAWQAPSGNTQTTTLTDPSGDVVPSGSRRLSATQTNEVWEVANPEPGEWSVQVSGLNQEYLVSATARTDIELHPFVGTPADESTQGAEVPIVAAFVGESGPLLEAQVTASVRDPLGRSRTLTLHDDGAHGDTEPGDGVYGNTYTATAQGETVIDNPVEGEAPEVSGSYLVDFTAVSGDHVREAQGSFAIGAAPDGDGDGLPDAWEAEHGTDPGAPDATGDDDGDGLSVLCEYQAGTDPRTGDSDDGGESDGSEVVSVLGVCTAGDRDPLDLADDRVGPLHDVDVTAEVDAGGPLIVVTWGEPERGDLVSVDVACRTVDADGRPTGGWVLVADDATGGRFAWRGGVLGQRYECRVIPTVSDGNGDAFPGPEVADEPVTLSADPYAPAGSVLIDGGAPSTADRTVTLDLSAGDNLREEDGESEALPPGTPVADLQMRLSNSPDFAGAVFEPFRAQVADWDLGPVEPGEHGTVYLELRDAEGNVSDLGMGMVDTILYAPGERFSGPTRIETAVEVSKADFGDGQAAVALLARADTFPDALAGTPLAVQEGGPVLLTDTGGLHPAVAAELQRALPPGRTVYLLGGEVALGPAVEQAVTELGYTPVRLAGPSRIETAIAIADALGTPDPLLVTTGFDFPDALAAGAAAAANGGAVLLTNSESRHPATDAYLAAHAEAEVYGVGGPAARPYPEAQPVFGPTREGTAVAVAETFFTLPRTLGLTRRDVFADALTGGPHIARLGAPVLLTPSDSLHPDPSAYACANRASASGAFVYGGQAAVTDAVAEAMQARLRGDGC